MFRSLCILGRQPALGLAELESLYGADRLKPVGSKAVLVDKEPNDVSFAFLGGTVKFCKILTQLDTIDWQDINDFLVKSVPEHASKLAIGKLRIGLSAYDLKIQPKQLMATALEVKRTLKKSGRSSRFVPNVELALNSAQVLHNKLTDKLGWELILVKNGNKTIVAQSVAVQDIESYSKRDYGRPKRDTKVGMLPPKLAQIIINLAIGSLKPSANHTILDPFCGSGVILQEACLMGFSVYGTDIDPRMVDYSQHNLAWLKKNFPLSNCTPDSSPRETGPPKLEVADATKCKWQPSPSFVASELYLGKAFTNSPEERVFGQNMEVTNNITKNFLMNMASQTKTGFRMCIAIPVWYICDKVMHLPVLDQLTDMGYNRLSFVHAANKDLIYHREDQIVGRELLVLVRK